MGISEADLAFLAKLEDFKRFRSVCDLGDQDLLCNDEGAFRACGFGDAPMRGRAADFWKARGMRHLSLDMVGAAKRFDLNRQSVPLWWRRFDLVTNCGNTEHVINQFNCFRVMHDLAKVGGVMYHQVPVSGYSAHGFFKYNPRFFSLLAAANGYNLLHSHAESTGGTSDGPPGPDTPDNLERWRAVYRSDDAGLRIALRKVRFRSFRPPLDLPG